MTLQEAVATGLPFKRLNHDEWYKPDDVNFSFSKEDLLADDWVVKNVWYDGIGEKYPNGVLCYVWDYDSEGLDVNKRITVVVDYVDGDNFPFKTADGDSAMDARPVTTKEAPAILDESELQKIIIKKSVVIERVTKEIKEVKGTEHLAGYEKCLACGKPIMPGEGIHGFCSIECSRWAMSSMQGAG